MFRDVQKSNHCSLVPVNLRGCLSLQKKKTGMRSSLILLLTWFAIYHVDTLHHKANKRGQANKEDRGPKATLSRAAP